MRNVLRSLPVHLGVLVVLLTGTATLAVLAAASSVPAQVPKEVRRIGFLNPDPADTVYGSIVQPSFTENLRRLGYAVGRDLLIEWRWGDGTSSSLPPLAEELVKLEVELIVARSDAIPAAIGATSSIPIVMLNGNFPVEVGYIKSLARPGGNVTGTAYFAPETVEKNLQLLKEFAPRVKRVGILGSRVGPRDEVARIYLGAVHRAAVSLNMTVEGFDPGKGTLEEVRAALETMAARGIEALIYPSNPLYRAHTRTIAIFLRDRRIFSFSTVSGFAELGGLFDYAPDGLANLERTASYVDRILKGAKPADLPVELPAKHMLTVNLKTAKALGVAVPSSILLRANSVIELDEAYQPKDWVDIKNPQELRELHSNKTFRDTNWVLHYRADGKGVRIPQGGKPQPRTWEVKGEDQVCVITVGGKWCWRYQRNRKSLNQIRVTSRENDLVFYYTVEDGIPKF